MLARLRAMWHLITQVGSASRTVDKLNEWVRFCVLDALNKTGLFDYLSHPHTLDEILRDFGFVDSEFTRYVFAVLTNEKDGVLRHEGDRYSRDPNRPLPTEAEIQQSVPAMIRQLETSREHAAQIANRMTGKPIEFTQRLESQREALVTFDDTLASRIYDAGRTAAFLWARPYLGKLAGKRLLDVGCGSGREAAHLWLLCEGKVQITAVDTLESFVAMSQERFKHFVEAIGQNRPTLPVSDANRPTFAVMDAGQLEFPDASFDYVFHSGMLHWTSDASKALGEMLRVLRPGGVLFGATGYKPRSSGFVDLTVRLNEGVGGFPTYDQVIAAHLAGGAPFEELISGIYRARKQS